MLQRALDGYKKAVGLDHTSTLDALYNLGVFYKEQGRLKEAEEMYQRALEGYEKALGPDHREESVTLVNSFLLSNYKEVSVFTIESKLEYC
jgi:tetratricopeptide (TPR) repeat protein